MTPHKPTLHDNVKLLEAILDRVTSIDRNVDDILDRLAGAFNAEGHSWYESDDNHDHGNNDE